jgi:hypothetical protein
MNAATKFTGFTFLLFVLSLCLDSDGHRWTIAWSLSSAMENVFLYSTQGFGFCYLFSHVKGHRSKWFLLSI